MLLAALGGALALWRPDAAAGLLVDVEGHGREPLGDADLSRTVGWFTAAHPVRMDVAGIDLPSALAGGAAAGTLLKTVKEQVRDLPGDGLGHELLRHLNPETAPVLAAAPAPQVGFNYMGRFTAGTRTGSTAAWQVAGGAAIGGSVAPDLPLPHALEANVSVEDTAAGPTLELRLSSPSRRHRRGPGRAARPGLGRVAGGPGRPHHGPGGGRSHPVRLPPARRRADPGRGRAS
ncbi:hypothetical protein SALBM135S_09485 [Streptomyces alboniger]